MKLKQILIPLFSLAVCTGILWKWTDGFSAFTIYSYTLKEAGPAPRPFPDILFVNQNGHVFDLRTERKYVLINFVYLNCPGVCQKIDNRLEDIYHLMDTTLVPSQLQFVTVSFDLKNDDIPKIKMYRSMLGTGINGWTFALPYQTSGNEFHRFLQKVGIWEYRIPETGLINHSVYMFLVSPQSNIVKIFDPARETNSAIIEQIYQCLKET